MKTASRFCLATAVTFLCAFVCEARGIATSGRPTPDTTLSAALAATPNEQRGVKLFNKHCAQCHQSDAQGVADRQVPALAGQQYEYLLKQLVDFIDFERANDTMHGVLTQRGTLDAQAIADIVAYVANLPMNTSPSKGDGNALAAGKKIFFDYCASCHDRTAEGNADLWVPNLRGQHYSYLVKQMLMMARAQRSNISDDMHRMFGTYAPEELEAVADYLTRWPAD